MSASGIWDGVLAVFIGWALAQLTGLISDYRERRRINRALLDELSEIGDLLNMTWGQWAKSLRMIAAGQVDMSVPMPVTNVIYTNHYHRAALTFNRYQRRSMQMAHSYIDKVNRETEKHRDYLESLFDPVEIEKELTPEIEGHVRESAKLILFTTRQAQWHIKYHFDRPLFPIFEAESPEHKEYSNFLESVRLQISEIESAGADQTPADFDPGTVTLPASRTKVRG